MVRSNAASRMTAHGKRHLVALVVNPTTGAEVSASWLSRKMEGIDWSQFPQLTDPDRESVRAMATAMGQDVVLQLLGMPQETHLPIFRGFRSFVEDQVRNNTQTEVSKVTHQGKKHIRALEAQRDAFEAQRDALQQALETAVKSAAQRPAQDHSQPKPKAVKLDAPKFDGTNGDKLVHWLLAIERSGMAQLIQTEEQLVSLALSNLRGAAYDWAYSSLLADSDVFSTWIAFKSAICEVYQPPNHEALLQSRFFSMKQGKRTLHAYVQEMRTVAASITRAPLTESVKVPAFVNGLARGPARQELFRRMPSTMEDAIRIALIEDQSFQLAQAPPGGSIPKPFGGGGNGPTPMDLGNTEESDDHCVDDFNGADVICHACGKRGHYASRCYSRNGYSDGRSARGGRGGRTGRGNGGGFRGPPRQPGGYAPAAGQGNANPQ